MQSSEVPALWDDNVFVTFLEAFSRQSPLLSVRPFCEATACIAHGVIKITDLLKHSPIVLAKPPYWRMSSQKVAAKWARRTEGSPAGWRLVSRKINSHKILRVKKKNSFKCSRDVCILVSITLQSVYQILLWRAELYLKKKKISRFWGKWHVKK